jgi:FkbM family methyltransferase
VHPLHQIRRVRAFRALARAVDRPVWARVYGVPHPVRLYLLRNASYLLNRCSPEPHVAALVLAILRTRPVGCFWDVGANIGYYSWLVASASPATKVLAIEPDPTNLAVLRESRAHAPQVEVLDVAVSTEDGTAAFLPDEVSGATGTMRSQQETFNLRNYGAISQPIEVVTRSLDSIGRERGFPDFLKVDVEGYEDQAIRGGVHLLERRPVILIEAFDPASPALAQLRSAGYRLLSADSLTEARPDDGNYLAIAEEELGLLPRLRDAYERALADAGLAPAARS